MCMYITRGDSLSRWLCRAVGSTPPASSLLRTGVISLSVRTRSPMTVVMGDLVLTESEITPVLSKLEAGGVEPTALHNHLLNESPRVMYMHIHAMGDGVKIAKTIHDALALTKTPFSAPVASVLSAAIGFDPKQIDQIMGQNGKLNGGVYQFSIARADEISDSGMMSGDHKMTIPAAMGLAQ